MTTQDVDRRTPESVMLPALENVCIYAWGGRKSVSRAGLK